MLKLSSNDLIDIIDESSFLNSLLTVYAAIIGENGEKGFILSRFANKKSVISKTTAVLSGEYAFISKFFRIAGRVLSDIL